MRTTFLQSFTRCVSPRNFKLSNTNAFRLILSTTNKYQCPTLPSMSWNIGMHTYDKICKTSYISKLTTKEVCFCIFKHFIALLFQLYVQKCYVNKIYQFKSKLRCVANLVQIRQFAGVGLVPTVTLHAFVHIDRVHSPGSHNSLLQQCGKVKTKE